MRNPLRHPGCVHSGNRISAPHNRGCPGIVGDGVRNLEGSLGKGRDLEYPHRPVPHDGAGSRNLFRENLRSLRPDIEGHHVGGDGLSRADRLDRRVGVDLVRNHMVYGQEKLQLASLGFLQKLAGEVHFVFFDQRLADLLPLRLQKCVGHASADDDGIHLVHQILNHPDFVAHLGTAQNGDKRLLRMLQGFAQISELLLHEQPGGRFLNKLGDPDGRGVGAMRSTERIIHVKVG